MKARLKIGSFLLSGLTRIWFLRVTTRCFWKLWKMDFLSLTLSKLSGFYLESSIWSRVDVLFYVGRVKGCLWCWCNTDWSKGSSRNWLMKSIYGLVCLKLAVVDGLDSHDDCFWPDYDCKKYSIQKKVA